MSKRITLQEMEKAGSRIVILFYLKRQNTTLHPIILCIEQERLGDVRISKTLYISSSSSI